MTETSSTKTLTKRSDPKIMTCPGLIGEIFMGNPNANRKNELLEAVYNRPITNDNIRDFLEAFKMCQRHKFFPCQITAKIDEIIRFIDSSIGLDKLMVEVCQSNDLPKKITSAACFKSKLEHQS